LVRRSLFNIMNGFDERFFVYLEDLDFSLRARKSGWRSYYLAEVQAFHKGGGTSENIKATRLFYALRSRILYGYKHFGWWAGTGLMAGTLFLEFLSRFVLASAHRSRKEINDLIDGYSMLLREIPNLLKNSSFRKDS
jgi:N-acetylglucosaminyl-diphospho-decaprenol L-rhamnosyltransferase